MKKNILVTSILILATLLVGCSQTSDGRELIKSRSGVTIPDEAKLVYHFNDTGFGNHGHGPQYTVYSFEEEPIAFFTSEFSYGGELCCWSNDTQVYDPIVSGTLIFIDERMKKEDENEIDEITTLFEIPEKYTYSWEEEYRYYKEKLNTFVYFKDTLILLYFYQGY